MWKLDILREGYPPETHEGVSIVYEVHREDIVGNYSDTVVAYNALSERIRGIRSSKNLDEKIYPLFLESRVQFSGKGGPIVEKRTVGSIIYNYLVHELEGEETWELTPLPEK